MPTTFMKRNKEKLRQEKQRDKLADRQARKTAKENRPEAESGVDPDIAGIIPGPQPIDIEAE